MSIDPYKSGMLQKSPYADKVAVTGEVVAILDFATNRRGLRLISQPSRAVRAGEVHELILTGEEQAGPDQEVNDVAYLAFIEFRNAGVLVKGDAVTKNGDFLGELAGFDETHMPNHQNIVLRGPAKATGVQIGLQTGDEISFRMAKS
ncbi:MAG: DUF6917 domain-containing protein [bacterium]|jgi:hypothetical protein